MNRSFTKWLCRSAGGLTLAALSLSPGFAQSRVSIGVTETIETANPYGDSVSLLYGIWSEITGPFCTYNYSKGDFEGRLAERWKVQNPTTWMFYLSKDYKFNDGTPVTADDVVASWKKIVDRYSTSSAVLLRLPWNRLNSVPSSSWSPAH